MKVKNKRILAIASAILLSLSMIIGAGIAAYAEDADNAKVTLAEDAVYIEDVDATEENDEINADGLKGEDADEKTGSETDTDNGSSGKEENLFDQAYKLCKANADKIFSILAFVGTIVISIGYKSGLLPLLREALSKLKGSIDGVKADGVATDKALKKLSEDLKGASEVINQNASDLQSVQHRLQEIDMLSKDWEAMQTVLLGQIDMLYAIFMSSALPQYQKDEVGQRIGKMREVLRGGEYCENQEE